MPFTGTGAPLTVFTGSRRAFTVEVEEAHHIVQVVQRLLDMG